MVTSKPEPGVDQGYVVCASTRSRLMEPPRVNLRNSETKKGFGHLWRIFMLKLVRGWKVHTLVLRSLSHSLMPSPWHQSKEVNCNNGCTWPWNIGSLSGYGINIIEGKTPRVPNAKWYFCQSRWFPCAAELWEVSTVWSDMWTLSCLAARPPAWLLLTATFLPYGSRCYQTDFKYV